MSRTSIGISLPTKAKLLAIQAKVGLTTVADTVAYLANATIYTVTDPYQLQGIASPATDHKLAPAFPNWNSYTVSHA